MSLWGLFSLNSEAREHSPWMFSSSGDRKSSLNVQVGFFWSSLHLETPLGSICGVGCSHPVAPCPAGMRSPELGIPVPRPCFWGLE